MIKHIVEIVVPNATAERFYDFMINPCDKRYSEWWPGEHLQFHILENGDENHVGDILFMDEYLGSNHRLTFKAITVTANRPNKIEWQMMKAGLRLPAIVNFELFDSDDGLRLKHELRLGYSGVGKILDSLIKLYFNKSFQNALDEHCKKEWFKLVEYLASES